MKLRKTQAKTADRYHFSGVIKDAYEYTAKDGNDFVVLVCRDKQDEERQTPDRDVLFSNYKSKFESLSAGLDSVEPGSSVEIDYCLYKNDSGKTYFNFIDVKFPSMPPSQDDLDSLAQEFKAW